MKTVRIAAVQAAPVWLDRQATIETVVALAEQAAAEGAGLVAFPEAFVPGYPDWVWRTRPWDHHATELYARLLDQAVVVGSAATDTLADVARRLGIWLSVGVDELDTGSTTVYNTLLHFSPDGSLAARHRKLVATGGERLVWGMGDGSTLAAIETPFGRLGGLICWENYMPLLRAAMYAKGIQLYCAPTVDDREVWPATMRHIALEGRCFVLSACQWSASEKIGGGSLIVGPLGNVLAGPNYEGETILTADIDVGEIAEGKFDLDVAGHYARPDVFRLEVNEERN